MRYALSVIALTTIYCFTLASFHYWDIVIGGLLSVAVIVVFHAIVFPASNEGDSSAVLSLWRRIIMTVPMGFAIVWEITRGTWVMLLIVLGIRDLHNPGIVAIPIGDRTESGIAFSGIATTLSPGTVFVDVDWEHGLMLIHAIDATDPESVRAAHQHFYDRFQRHVFP